MARTYGTRSDNDFHMEKVYSDFGLYLVAGSTTTCANCGGRLIEVNPGYSYYCKQSREMFWIKPDTYFSMMLNQVAPIKTTKHPFLSFSAYILVFLIITYFMVRNGYDGASIRK